EALTQVITARLRAKGVFVRYDAEERIKTGLDKGASIYDIFPFTTEEETKGHKNRAINPLYIFTSPTKEMWLIDFFKLEDYRDEIKELIYQKDRYFVKVFDGKKVIISSTYLNFENLPDNYIGDRIAGMPAELVNFNIYGDPFSKSGGEYAYGFNYSDHVDPSVKYSAGYPLHFTVDFNTSPYMSGLVAQLVPMRSEIAGYKWNNRESWLDLNFIYEYSLSHPRNSAGHLGEAFAEDFSHLSGHGIFVYGDATGKNKVPIKGVESAFSDLLLPLDRFLFRDSLRIPASNPSYKHISKDMLGRRDFTNMLFEGKHPVRVRISPKCANYIRDLEFCTEDVNGRLAKPKNKDGIEEMGHHLQAGEYFYCHPKSLGYLAEY
uniref:hypothetical protein n=1 Tax=Muriicola sp. TaxID=2020856 RepID=UPI00356A37DF